MNYDCSIFIFTAECTRTLWPSRVSAEPHKCVRRAPERRLHQLSEPIETSSRLISHTRPLDMLSEQKRSDKNWGLSETGQDGWWHAVPLCLCLSIFSPSLSQPWTEGWCRGWSVWNARTAADVTSGRCGYHKRRQWWIRRGKTLQDARSALFPPYSQCGVRIFGAARTKKKIQKTHLQVAGETIALRCAYIKTQL